MHDGPIEGRGEPRLEVVGPADDMAPLDDVVSTAEN
jgi:hypothetical protein